MAVLVDVMVPTDVMLLKVNAPVKLREANVAAPAMIAVQRDIASIARQNPTGSPNDGKGEAPVVNSQMGLPGVRAGC